MRLETLAQLTVTVIVAMLGSQWFGEWIKSRKGISNKAILDKIDSFCRSSQAFDFNRW